MLTLPAVWIGATLIVAVAERVPDYDVRPSCHAATSLMSLDPKREVQCLNDEDSARREVARQWAGFQPVDRERCAAEAQLDGTPSYVDLLECLTLAREAKAGKD
ncbi:hypothetical protein F6X51_16410 [Methylobacterium planeticum]|uniref:Uncharacterized protein n=2 Tax=Methylobacterium planeticum TaxID=2615211 RepID=A0A6N6MQK2_9HYPH|nr:hypothetical protein F6X51_16410 [Methylobacterium planeticum]